MKMQENRLLRYFEYDHLPLPLRNISRLFHDLARSIVHLTPAGPEQTVALRKLLESKDAAVRSALPEKEEKV